MTTSEAIEVLKAFKAWGDSPFTPFKFDPKQIDEAITVAIKIMEESK